jgi:hypothetical protein
LKAIERFAVSEVTMGKAIGSYKACKQFFLMALLGKNRFYKISSMISSLATLGFVLNLYHENFLKYAASMRNRCIGTMLELITKLLPYTQSTSGRMFLLFVLSASLVGYYLIKQEIIEAQELGTTLFATILVVAVCVAVHVGASKIFWTCVQ